MKVIKGFSNFPSNIKRPVVALGVFDGVHKGHQKIIREAIKKAKAINGTSVVLTFDPHPLKLLGRETSIGLITSLKHRVELIRSLKADICVIVNFNRYFSRISAQNFVRQILIDAMGISCLVIGRDFRFGKNKSGSLALLQKLSKEQGFTIKNVKPLRISRRAVSSSLIRKLITKGAINQANRLLGRNFSLSGEVTKGNARGRFLGFPTANIEPEQEIIPLQGVYAVRVKIERKMYNGVLNIGRRPTFDFEKKRHPVIEVHISSFSKNIYGKKLEIFFVKRIRPERKFPNHEALKKQIKRDELAALRILK
jgi:riboflavin kinase/FMN adenylyltransferase